MPQFNPNAPYTSTDPNTAYGQNHGQVTSLVDGAGVPFVPDAVLSRRDQPTFDPSAPYSAVPPAQQPTLNLSNPQGQGTYQMVDPNGQTVAVPYGQVQQAAQGGYSWADDANRWRYAKDNAADPHRTTSLTPVAAEQTPEGHKAAVYAREDATGPIGQIGIGVAKAGGTIVKPIGDLASVVSGDDGTSGDQTDYTEARGGLQTAGKVAGIVGSLAPAAIEAPVALATGLGTGTISGMVGQVLGQHLGLNDKQTALLSDLMGLAGGVGGGAAAAKFAPGGTTPLTDLISNRYTAGDGVFTSDGDTITIGRTPPLEKAVYKAVGKSGLEPGMPAEAPPTPEDLQPALHAGVRQIAADVASDAGLDAPQPTTIRDTFGSVGRGVYSAAKSDYATLDKASGGRWQRYDDAISNIDRKMGEVAGIDDDAYENLQNRKNEIETLQAQLIEDMKAGGKVDPAIADRATAQYRRSMALGDVNKAIQASTKQTVVDGQVREVLDPNALSQRLAKLNDLPLQGGDSRLVQALGQDSANTLVDHVNQAQIAARNIKEYVPATATGQMALEDIIRPNTRPKPGLTGNGVATDWQKSLEDFERIEPNKRAQMWGLDEPKVRRFLYGQARKQNAIGLLTKLGIGGGAVGLGIEGLNLVKHAVRSAVE